MYKIIYVPEAELDRIEILLYYAEKGGLDLADAINHRIQVHINRLQTMPFRAVDSSVITNAKGFLIEKLPYRAYFKHRSHRPPISI